MLFHRTAQRTAWPVLASGLIALVFCFALLGGGHYYDEAAVAQELSEASAALREEWADPCD